MKRIFTNNGLLQIFFSLLLVIFVMFASNYFVYKNSISGIFDKVSQNNALVVKSIVKSFDNSFRTVNNLIYTIRDLPPRDDLGSSGDGRVDMSKVYTMVENLNTLVTSHEFIEEVVVFYNDVNLAITSSGTSSLEYFFNRKYTHDIYNYNYWRSYVRTNQTFKVFPAENFRIFTEVDQKTEIKKMMVAVGGNKFYSTSKNVLVLIDVEALMEYVDQKSMIPGASLIVMDEYRNILLSTDGSMNLMDVLNDVYFRSANTTSLTRGNYEYNFYRSEYNDYIYIDKVPFQFKNIDSVAKANSSIMLIAIICAVGLAVLLSIYLNRPVKYILQLLGGGSSRGNDFRKIQSGIVKLISENDAQREKIAFMDSELRKGVFFHAVDEYADEKEYDLYVQKYYPDFYRHPFFMMVLIQFNPQSDMEPVQTQAEQISQNLLSGLQNANIQSNLFHIGNLQYLAVIGLQQTHSREKLGKRLEKLVQDWEKSVFVSFSFRVCLSKVYTTNLENFKRAHKEVTNGIGYRNINGERKILDVENIHYEWNVYFPYESMERLTNYLLAGKLSESIEVIKETIHENVERNIHHHQLVHIAKTMFMFMLKQARGLENHNNQLYELELDFSLQIEHASHYQDVEKALIRVARFIASEYKNMPVNKLNPTDIIAYIEKNYSSNLYLDHVAEVFETSPKYFSSYFKKNFGINYVEYLNKVRLSHAREMMKDSKLSLAEIAEKNGYLNSSTFTNTYKKYFGISPSEDRKQMNGSA